MKLKIKVKRLNMFLDLPEVIKKGDLIDLRASRNVMMHAPRLKRTEEGNEVIEFDFKKIPLGVAMKLPKGFIAKPVPRSSTYEKYGITQANSIGIIDNSYSGNKDEWQFPALAFRDTIIPEGERICQYEIQLSQKATLWQKLKWLLSSGIEIVEVESLDNTNRGGFGSTGVK